MKMLGCRMAMSFKAVMQQLENVRRQTVVSRNGYKYRLYKYELRQRALESAQSPDQITADVFRQVRLVTRSIDKLPHFFDVPLPLLAVLDWGSTGYTPVVIIYL